MATKHVNSIGNLSDATQYVVIVKDHQRKNEFEILPQKEPMQETVLPSLKRSLTFFSLNLLLIWLPTKGLFLLSEISSETNKCNLLHYKWMKIFKQAQNRHIQVDESLFYHYRKIGDLKGWKNFPRRWFEPTTSYSSWQATFLTLFFWHGMVAE